MQLSMSNIAIWTVLDNQALLIAIRKWTTFGRIICEDASKAFFFFYNVI